LGPWSVAAGATDDQGRNQIIGRVPNGWLDIFTATGQGALSTGHWEHGNPTLATARLTWPNNPRRQANSTTLLLIFWGHAVAVMHRAWKRVDRRWVVSGAAIQSATRVRLQASAVRTCWT
jgi:hypothetical protein